MTANEWIERLGLTPHPEGGWFREVYRSHERITQDSQIDRVASAEYVLAYREMWEPGCRKTVLPGRNVSGNFSQ